MSPRQGQRLDRRSFVAAGASSLAFGVWPISRNAAASFFTTRGLVITPEDLSLGDWPERADRAGLTTIALHPFPAKVLEFVRTAQGQEFLERSYKLGLQVEYELHAMRELLPRALFAKEKNLFRMNPGGGRARRRRQPVRPFRSGS
jgi:hypothetical protein